MRDTLGSKDKYIHRVLVFCIILAMLLLSFSPLAAAQEEEQLGPFTGPIDPAAGSWILYRGERIVPGQATPQVFFTRVQYLFPSGTPQEGTAMDAIVEELDPAGQVVSSRRFTIQSTDRSYVEPGSGEEGFWSYWLMSGLEEGDKATVGTDTTLTAEGDQEYVFKDNAYRTMAMRAEGLELQVERRTGLVFRMLKPDGESLGIEDTNMLAQYPVWGYYPDNTEVKKRLEDLAAAYPDLVEVSSVGKSVKGRDIWLAHITDFTSSESKRSILLDAALEGDDPEGCDFLLDFLDELTGLAQDDEAIAQLMRSLEIYAVPLVNPDGLQRWLAMPNPTENTTLSTQAPRNGNLVRINRNFDIKWAEGDRDPASPDYAGQAPFSEPESKVLQKLLDDIPFGMYIDLYTGPNLLNAPWNWSDHPNSNPEMDLYSGIFSELSELYTYPKEVGRRLEPFTGSSTDWAYEGNGASSPLCFNLYLPVPGEVAGEATPEEPSELKDRGSLFLYGPAREIIMHLMQNLNSYLSVDISAPTHRAEVNVPFDFTVEVKVSGRRALANAQARIILPEGGGLKLAAMSEKEINLGNLEPGSTAQATWNLEGRTSDTYIVEIVILSSYAEYEKIPGTYSSDAEVAISTQRTLLVLLLLAGLIVLVLGLVFLSMRKHRKTTEK